MVESALLLNIIPEIHPAVKPISLVESGKGITNSVENEVAKANRNAVSSPARKRKAEDNEAISKKMHLLLNKELSSDAQVEMPITEDLARAQVSAYRLKAMKLCKGLSTAEIETMKKNADLLLQ